jgi:hypothetical protein
MDTQNESPRAFSETFDQAYDNLHDLAAAVGTVSANRLFCLVGARGFEPPTTCTPCRCATRLRYAPRRASVPDCQVAGKTCTPRWRADESIAAGS